MLEVGVDASFELSEACGDALEWGWRPDEHVAGDHRAVIAREL